MPMAIEFVRKLRSPKIVVYGHNLELYIATESKTPLAPYYYSIPLEQKGYLSDAELDDCFVKLAEEKSLLIAIISSEEDLLQPSGSESGFRSMLARRIAMGDLVRIPPEVSGIPMYMTKDLAENKCDEL